VADDGGLTLGELAVQRSISKDAARRLVKAGKIAAHQTNGSHGPAWCLHPDSEIPERNGSAGAAPGLRHGPATVAQPADVAALVVLVDRLTTENRELVGAVAAWQSQAVVLAGRLMDAEQRLALTAPPSPVLASPSPQTVAPSLEPPSPRWHLWVTWGLTVAVLVAVVVGLLVWR